MRAPHFLALSALIAQKQQRDRTDHADYNHGYGVRDEIGINHEREAAEHHFPESHSFAVNEGNETDRPEDKAADQICSAEIKHRV
jgi:hypothetical protein